jgi:hypothetical protein
MILIRVKSGVQFYTNGKIYHRSIIRRDDVDKKPTYNILDGVFIFCGYGFLSLW